VIKKLILTTSIVALTAIGLQAKQGIKYYNIKGDASEKLYHMIEKDLPAIGFLVTDPHKKINEAYKKKYGRTIFDTLDFFPIVNEGTLKTLLEKEPRLAGFNPFDLFLYKAKDDNASHVGHLTPDTILDILKIDNKEIREGYKASFPALDKLLVNTLGDNVSYAEYDALPEDRMMNFEVSIPKDANLEDFIDDFQEKFEEAFEKKEYIIAGFQNFKEAYEETDDKFATYDAFWTYSLCHFKFSYAIFDNGGSRAGAGVFAPCTMYMYIKKDSKTLVIGMPKLANWQAVSKIVDPKRVDFIKQLDAEIPSIMRDTLGAKEIASDLGTVQSNEDKIKSIKTKIEALQKELKSLKGK